MTAQARTRSLHFVIVSPNYSSIHNGGPTRGRSTQMKVGSYQTLKRATIKNRMISYYAKPTTSQRLISCIPISRKTPTRNKQSPSVRRFGRRVNVNDAPRLACARRLRLIFAGTTRKVVFVIPQFSWKPTDATADKLAREAARLELPVRFNSNGSTFLGGFHPIGPKICTSASRFASDCQRFTSPRPASRLC